MLQALEKPLKFLKNIIDMLREENRIIKNVQVKPEKAGKEWKTKTKKEKRTR